jgi:Mrp family chromosome partitioning ATPase
MSFVKEAPVSPIQRSSSFPLADRLADVAQYSEIKRLADHIIQLQRLKPFRSLAVISLFPGEGKTLFSALMAMAYTDACQTRVLVVDTATQRHPASLVLKQCFNASYPLVDALSIDEYRRNGSTSRDPLEEASFKADFTNGTVNAMVKKESDQFLIRKLAQERASQYGLVLLDTAPLTTRNKGNIDPLLAARVADASVLVVNPQRMPAANLAPHLKILKDSSLHLMGIVSNGEVSL